MDRFDGRSVPRGTRICILLQGDREVEGRLGAISDREVMVGDEPVDPGEVRRFFRLEAKEWTAPERIDEIPLKTEVDVRFKNGDEVKSVLVGVAPLGFALDRGTFHKTEYFTLDEVEEFRKHEKLPAWAVWTITAGVVVGGIGAYVWCADAGKCAQ